MAASRQPHGDQHFRRQEDMPMVRGHSSAHAGLTRSAQGVPYHIHDFINMSVYIHLDIET